MAAKKTVYLNAPDRVRQIKQIDVDKLKKAFQKMFQDYLEMKKCQGKFEDSLGELCMMWHPWTIPAPWIKSRLKELHRTGVSRG